MAYFVWGSEWIFDFLQENILYLEGYRTDVSILFGVIRLIYIQVMLHLRKLDGERTTEIKKLCLNFIN